MIDDTINKEAVQNTNTENEITDVNLGYVEKRKFRFGGDQNRILELNVSDLNVFSRLKVGYPKLKTLLSEAREKIESIPDDAEDREELLNAIADRLETIDKDMRETIDFIFDANASEICAPSGTMYDPVGGGFRFQHILDTLSKLYTNGLNAEFNKIKSNVEKKTSKYTKKGHK